MAEWRRCLRRLPAQLRRAKKGTPAALKYKGRDENRALFICVPMIGGRRRSFASVDISSPLDAVSLSQTLSSWQLIENQAILVWDEGSFQTYWLDGRRSAPVAGNARGRIWTLRQQINVLRRAAPKKLSFSTIDRLIFVGLYRLFPRVCDALAIVKPDTIDDGADQHERGYEVRAK